MSQRAGRLSHDAMLGLRRFAPALLRPATATAPAQAPARFFRSTRPALGLEEFYDARHRSKVPEDFGGGRAWEASELRRKSFDDLHKLWYVLYKERNVLLTESARARRNVMRIKHPQRKTAVKLSMARIKQVLAERRQAYRDTE